MKNAFGKGGMNGSNDTHLPREVMKAVPAQFGFSGVSCDICAQLRPVGPMWDQDLDENPGLPFYNILLFFLPSCLS